MIKFLLLNWRSALAVLATATIAYGLHWAVSMYTEIKHAAELDTLRTELLTACSDAQQRTSKADNEHRKKIADLRKYIASVERMHNNVCVQPLGSPSGQPDAASRGEQRRDVGIEAAWLVRQAGTCDEQATQLNDLIDFVCQEYAAHGITLHGCIR